MGPSSSHTMAPRKAASLFLERAPKAAVYRVTLYGSLSATGRGHLTHQAITDAMTPHTVELIDEPDVTLPYHPNGMRFEAFDDHANLLDSWQVYSIGGGALSEGEEHARPVYKLSSMNALIRWSEESGQPLWMYVQEREDDSVWEHLEQVWHVMQEEIRRGLEAEGVLPGSLKLQRKAHQIHQQTRRLNDLSQRTGRISAYALAVSEENASGGCVVTAPTCGACGVLPAVLLYLQQHHNFAHQRILRALAAAGLIGNLVKHNASISGAEVGCQGEVGTACAMAAAAAAYLLGASTCQIEYAAEMGLEHHLGLTCDPVAGLVQIPCIERNAVAATRALDCAEYALLSDGRHRISFDQVVQTMKQTGHDLPSLYRETAAGGLASTYGIMQAAENR